MSQTTVEWLEKELEKLIPYNKQIANTFNALITQAKQMEMEQIEKAYEKGQDDKSNCYFGNEFFNETYKTK